MAKRLLIRNAVIVNEGKSFPGSVLIEGEFIKAVFKEGAQVMVDVKTIDAGGKYLMPGVIDDQVHFRDPGLTHKGDICTESRAAVAGGVTSFMDMPNTNPQTVTNALLGEKMKLASERSLANYAFYLGATNDNLNELLATDARITCGIKVFMGASTGNMLVDSDEALTNIFSKVPHLIAIHSEYEPLIRTNAEFYREKYGEDVPIRFHPIIRSEAACFQSTKKAIDLARKFGTRLHILHLSTKIETTLLDPFPLIPQKRITSEVCVHHLWFTDEDYESLGTLIKWNPAIKTKADRHGLRNALKEGIIDIVATDHAPHTLDEKSKTYFNAPSGGPLVQHSLPMMLELVRNGEYTPAQVVDLMCHKPAICFGVEKRGYIREGYYADLVIVDPEQPWTVDENNILYKCGWSPLIGTTFHSKILHTFVNGHHVFQNGKFNDTVRGQSLLFSH